jgi:hypothetical protein
MLRRAHRRKKRKSSTFDWLTIEQEKIVLDNFSARAQQKILTKIKEGFSITRCNADKIELKGMHCFYMIGTEGNMDLL